VGPEGLPDDTRLVMQSFFSCIGINFSPYRARLARWRASQPPPHFVGPEGLPDETRLVMQSFFHASG